MLFVRNKMKIYSTREMIRGLDISTTALYNWKDEGLPVIKQSPYLFGDESLKWVIANKPDYAEKAKQMLEG